MSGEDYFDELEVEQQLFALNEWGESDCGTTPSSSTFPLVPATWDANPNQNCSLPATAGVAGGDWKSFLAPITYASAWKAVSAPALPESSKGNADAINVTVDEQHEIEADVDIPALHSKRKADDIDVEEQCVIEKEDIVALIEPLRNVVSAAYPADGVRKEHEKASTVASHRVCLPALVAGRLLHCEPTLRSEDPTVHEVIHATMSANKKYRPSTSGNVLLSCNLAPTRSTHLQEVTDAGPVLPYTLLEPTS
ncbi:hypothetical protein K474DRAFT_1714378 [Panus rudis PR-1116 ss-1]|nr:hypothetical protein K474DRAFT_1714378 [Panus rudis PR-1116 ss-1]